MPAMSNNRSWLFSIPQSSSISTPSTAFSDPWQGSLPNNQHGRVPSSQEQFLNHSHTTLSDTDWSGDIFTRAKPKRPRTSRFNRIPSHQSSNWPLTEKSYPTTTFTKDELRCPKRGLWKAILVPTIIIILPMACLVAGLLGLIFGYRVRSDTSLFPQVSNSDTLGDHAVVLVNYSATRIAFVASWASTLAPLLAAFIMNLMSYQTALNMLRSSSGTNQHDLPSPYQYSLVVGLCLASIGRLGRYWIYSTGERVIVPPVLRRAARTLSLTLLLAVVVFAADTALHYTTTTINFDQVTIVAAQRSYAAYGFGLSETCLSLKRTDNFNLPCSRNGQLAQHDYNAYVAGQNEVFFLQHGTSNVSEVKLVLSPGRPSTSEHGSVAILMPQSRNLSPYRDFRSHTAGVVTTCAPVSSECQWKTLGPDDSYSQFNCTKNFYGVLGKPPTMTANGLGFNDSDIPPLGFKPGSGLQYAYFMDENLTTPYDSTGDLRPVLTDAQLINPVYFALAARFAVSAQRAGVSMADDPGIHKGPTQNIDFVLKCQYTTYDAEYTWVNSTAEVHTLEPSPNGTLAEIFHGYRLVGTDSAFDNDLGDDILQAALEADPTSMADNFADSFSQRVMSVIGPFLSARTNSQEQDRTPLLVAKVPKAPLAILVACCIAYVIFGVVAAVVAYRALDDVDVRDIAARFSLAALSLHAFREASTNNSGTVEVDMAGHLVFDESKIRGETSRVGVEGEPRSGFVLKSLV
ncbi:uncharacterized protein PV06_04049 [Exophiala oligosperma]|uniref:Uncharacterized protein n=1 Tax=Exophiala oligosperma TaxID=215243 RepID=A0A0D2DRR9_9EURO|nr:uncharacterized protein PV06_04049 [Exophiala oligosperma]KIW45678.1 hypothetical protein PV06_04049 [Exophiala oligosperma]